MIEDKTEETVPDTCFLCDQTPKILCVEERKEKYDIRCDIPEHNKHIYCKRRTLELSVKFWNKVQRAKRNGTYKPKINVTHERDVSVKPERCKCGLILPCHDCLKDATYYARSTKSSHDLPSARVR